ncbi:MAG: HYR domain-containing protein, partial [Bacteroidetes bacterium]
ALLERTWVAIDPSGNADTTLQRIWIRRATLDMVEFPPHFDGFDQPPLECGTDDPADLERTGRPTIDNYPLTIDGECELTVAYNDQVSQICGGEVKIVRTWTVFDVCTQEFAVYAQIIRVEDNQPPQMVCPQEALFTTYSSACAAQVWLPSAVAEDACSAVSVTPAWQFGSGYGPFNNVPPGTYPVTYTAEDACGNQSTCTMQVVVLDDDPPTPICETTVFVPLQADGTALAYAETFDNGSHDNCGITYLEVGRTLDAFDEFVYFDCQDFGHPVDVYLRVYDAAGAMAQCKSQVIVQDDQPPELLCPPSTTLDCGADYTNTALTGVPFAQDNCSVAQLSFTDEVNLNGCGLGSILRTWTATDPSGNSSQCTQTIFIEDNSPITVLFPADIVSYECDLNTDPSHLGQPLVIGEDCEQLGISNNDFIFYTAYPACYKLVRQWAVIDWCSYQPNDPDEVGIWEHTQVIEVRDQTPPELNCPPDLTVGIEGDACETFVTLEPPLVSDCSEEIQLTHDSPFGLSPEDPSGVYPAGEHLITFSATDGCGNVGQCTFRLTVVDAEPPRPVCNNGVSVTIQQNGLVTITPDLLENGSTDNCSAPEDLILQVSPNTFDCTQLGNHTVTLTVTDQAGNSAFCQTTVVVQDNFGVCPPSTQTATIAGRLDDAFGEPLHQMVVGLSGGINMAVHTDVDGTYDFQGLPKGLSYTVKPTYDKDPLNGVTTFDLVLIQRHILNIEPLDSPYKRIAADVNKSGSITTLDLVELRRLILGRISNFTNNQSWRFVPADYVFKNPDQAPAEDFPESLEFQGLDGNRWNQNFIGIKVGDVNGSAVTGEGVSGSGLEQRSEGPTLLLHLEDRPFAAGALLAVPVFLQAEDRLTGFQFALRFDPAVLRFEGLEPMGGLLPHLGDAFLEDGLLRFNWFDAHGRAPAPEAPLFVLRFRTRAPGRTGALFALETTGFPAEAYLARDERSQPLLHALELQFRPVQASTLTPTLAAYPNP